MSKTMQASDTLEFKLEAVQLVRAGRSVAAVTPDVPVQSISNRGKAE